MKISIPRISIPLSIIALVGSVFIRTVLENFSNPEPAGGFTNPIVFLSYVLFYVVVTFSLAILIGVLTKEKWWDISKLGIVGMPIIWLAPIFDIFYSGTACLSYGDKTGFALLNDFLTFFGPLIECGATIGLRLEIAIIILAVGWYVWLRTNSPTKMLVGMFGSYVIIFFHGALPGIIANVFSNYPTGGMFFGKIFKDSLLASVHTFTDAPLGSLSRIAESIGITMGRIHTLFLAPLILLIIAHDSPKLWRAFCANTRMSRILYYSTILVLGLIFAIKQHSLIISSFDTVGFIVLLLSFFSLLWFSVAINDLYDEDTDSISNPTRPLIAKTFSRSDMWNQAIVTLSFFSMTLFFVNPLVSAIFCTVFVISLFHSLPPFQLKRHFIPASFLLGAIGAGVFMMGYFFAAPEQIVQAFPGEFVIVLYLLFFILSNIKDLKDFSGDKESGVVTLSTLFGIKKSMLAIIFALSFWCVFAAQVSSFSYTTIFSVIVLPNMLAVLYLWNKKTYSEMPFAVALALSFIGIFIYII